MRVKTFLVWLALTVWFAFGAGAQVSMESVTNASLSYSPPLASKTTTTKLTLNDLFAQMGLSAGGLICSGNALDPDEAWTFKHRKPAATRGAPVTDTDLAGKIDMEILGYSQTGVPKVPSSVAPKASVTLGKIARNSTVKLTVKPTDKQTFEFWGSLRSSYTVLQEKGSLEANWIPSSMSMTLPGITDSTAESTDRGAASLTLILGTFKQLSVTTGTSSGLSFVRIPGGTYQMGNLTGDSDIIDAGTVGVTLSPYYMAVHPTTKAQWDSIRTWATANGYTDLVGAGLGKASNHPVVALTWHDVVKWANAASEKEGLTPCYKVAGSIVRTGNSNAVTCDWTVNGYRLPTEAEWEVAARGGLSGKRFPWGDTISQSQANYWASTNYAYDLSGSVNDLHPTYKTGEWQYTSPVGSFAANGYGLYDMAGNVLQWCWDWYGRPYAGGTDPRGAGNGSNRVLRGGSWGSYANYVRSASRLNSTPALAYSDSSFGFRLARGRL